jgi:NitT/TauT family transport system substrate-binding protein
MLSVSCRRGSSRAAALALVLLVACSSPPAAQPAANSAAPAPAAPPPTSGAPREKTNVVLRLGWLARGYDAPYYYALARGYYDQAGLNVEIKEGQGSGPTLNLVAGGQEQFGMVDGAVLLIGAGKGLPARMVAGVMQRSPAALMVHADSGIDTPRDLAGKSAGMVPGANTTLLLPSYLEAVGLPAGSLNIINTDNANKTTLFRQRRYEVTSSLTNDEVITLQADGENVRALSFADGGVNTISVGIVAHSDLIRDNPELVRRFVGASLRGWEEAIKSPAEAVADLMQAYPSYNPDVVSQSLQATVPLLHTRNNEGQPLGWMARADWQETHDLLAQAGLVQEPVSVDNLYTNDFVPSR